MKGVTRFGKKGTLSLRFIGLFEILRRVGEVTYELALPPSPARVHLVFHVSMLRKYHGDPTHILDFNSVQLDKDLSYVEEPVAIFGQAGQKAQFKEYCFCKGQVEGSAGRGGDLGDRAGYAQPVPSSFHSFRYVFILVRERMIILRRGGCNDLAGHFDN